MKNLKHILFFLAVLFLGSMLNGAILNIGMQIIPPPEGFDMNNPDELALAMKHMQVRHFISPFFAHALGTLLSAVLFYYFSKSQKQWPMLLIGSMFFAAGLYMVIILPSPWWFTAIDLGLAYFPMAYIGYRIGKRNVS